MTATRRQVTAAIAVFVGLLIVGMVRSFGTFSPTSFGPELIIGVLALWPVIMVVGLVWFGRAVLASLRRIERAVADNALGIPEFTHGS